MRLKRLLPGVIRRRNRDRLARRRHLQELSQRDGLKWASNPPCRDGLYDAATVRIGHLFFVMGGYTQLSAVNSLIHIFDLQKERWTKAIRMPDDVPQSHCAVDSDGDRFIYFVSGQHGAECSPAVDRSYSYDIQTDRWHPLPPLPQARYAGTVRLWRGRLHFVGGAKEDRWTPANEHWSIGVSDGNATETGWMQHGPIPIPGMHRGSVVVDDQLYVMGGQQGDFVAMEGAPKYRCTPATQETYLAACFRLSTPDDTWVRLADLPIPTSHTDFSVIRNDGDILVIGGQIYKNPADHHLNLTDVIQAYDIARDQWRIAGHLPHAVKMVSAATWRGQLFISGGQYAAPETDIPGPISHDCWKSRLSDLSSADTSATELSFFRGKSLLLVSHELSQTGAPMLLLETAQLLVAAGATVKVASVAGDHIAWQDRWRAQIPLVPIRAIESYISEVDFVIANTVSPPVTALLNEICKNVPEITQKLVCWVHEIDVERYLPSGEVLKDVALAIFDSDACRDAWQTTLGPLNNTVVINPAVNARLMEDLKQDLLQLPADPSEPHSAQLIAASREDVRQRLGVAADDFLVVCIGTVEQRKGQRLLLKTLARKAAQANLRIKLCLVGFLSQDQRIEFLDGLSDEERAVLSPERAYLCQSDIAAFYRAGDAFVMNSQGAAKNRGECFGRVTIEAMAAGMVVLGTAVGGTLDIIEHNESGYLFPVGEDGQTRLAEQLEQLIQDPDVAHALALAGQRRANTSFGLSRFGKEFTDAFKRSG